MQMFQGIKDWYKQPYDSHMSVNKWFLFLGMLIVIMAIWKMITMHLMDA